MGLNKVPKVGRIEDLDADHIKLLTARVTGSKLPEDDDYKTVSEEYGRGKYIFYLDRHHIFKVESSKEAAEERMLANFTMQLVSEHRYYESRSAAPVITRAIRFSFYRQGKLYSVLEELTHDETFKLADFKQRINGIGLLIFNGRPKDFEELMNCLDAEQKPKIVDEFEYDGLIEFKGEEYYLTENVAFKLPKTPEESLLAFALVDEQYFAVGDGRYISLKKGIKKRARFEPELVESCTESAKNLSSVLYSAQEFDRKLSDFAELIGQMVAGGCNQVAWGKALMGYLMHYLFLAMLRSPKGPQHGFFLYLFGAGNTGKGEVVKILNSFFGGTSIDFHSKPTESALGLILAQRSSRPVIVDEFVPESVAKRQNRGGILSDQMLNSAYQFDGRNVKDINRDQVRNENVRTSMIFLSNFLPETDHLKSRMILLQMTLSRRGDVQFLNQLKNSRFDFQRLFLSLLQIRAAMNPSLILSDALVVKKILDQKVKALAAEQFAKSSVTILDRQITSWSFFITLYHHAKDSFRKAREAQGFLKESLLEADFMELAVQELLSNILEMDDFNPLHKWLDGLGELDARNKLIYGIHYGYAELNGQKGKVYIGLRINRLMTLFNKEYPDQPLVTRPTIESLLIEKLGAEKKKMCFTRRGFNEELQANEDVAKSWWGFQIEEEQALEKDKELWLLIKDTFNKG